MAWLTSSAIVVSAESPYLHLGESDAVAWTVAQAESGFQPAWAVNSTLTQGIEGVAHA